MKEGLDAVLMDVSPRARDWAEEHVEEAQALASAAAEHGADTAVTVLEAVACEESEFVWAVPEHSERVRRASAVLQHPAARAVLRTGGGLNAAWRETEPRAERLISGLVGARCALRIAMEGIAGSASVAKMAAEIAEDVAETAQAIQDTCTRRSQPGRE